MLCVKGDKDILKSSSYFFEPKMDGTRCIAEVYENVKLFNRRGKNITKRYPFISKELKSFRGFVFDGEIVCYNENGLPDFYLLQKREIDNPIMIEIRSKTIPATYVIFDVIEKNNFPIIEKSIEERKEFLKDLEDEHLETIFYTDNGMKLWEEIEKRGIEGVIAKEKGSKYYPGERRKEWLKIKNLKIIDAVIVGYISRKREISSVAIALYKGKDLFYVGKVSGFDTETMNYMLKNFKRETKPPVVNPEMAPPDMVWAAPSIVAEIKYLEKTSNELRMPSFVRIREDKNAEDCKFEQIE